MKLLIDIDEKDYTFIKSVVSIMPNSNTFERIAVDLFKSAKSGIPIFSSHSRLVDVDADAFVSSLIYSKLIDNATCGEIKKLIDATTVIAEDTGDYMLPMEQTMQDLIR